MTMHCTPGEDQPCRVMVTGASGFVGKNLLGCLSTLDGVHPVAIYRHASCTDDALFDSYSVGDIGSTTDWSSALAHSDVVVHSAARVHVMNEVSADPLNAFREVNVEGTLNLARQAVSFGIKRFIFISSIKVNGESTELNHAYKADDLPKPTDPYGISKMEAEQQLIDLAATTDMEVVIIRPVLVYGPGVKANFLNMMHWLNKGVPLPFGSINNLRSMVALDNLIDLIVTCLKHPAAANQIFLVSDGEDLSTTILLKKMATALGKSAHLLPLPNWLLRLIFTAIGKQAIGQRLCSSLQVDINKTRDLLDWAPRVSVDNALRKTANDFLRSLNK
ncbi:UDP-glucose 4-epimerase family protein [Pseudomonas segetis]|uniref:UDP-glucose 4-epimerase n=1 Tax=Pseudomonas segetis TaxID=298908 RepID=A0A239A533_9PSED|nr:SDR family oxidoreductase [Pseudomonas segetis]SNR90776.1 UDP-glucose 4-epimerase [Pseudomonas segetis]